jgi:putative FmdB family regulatory protein
VPTYEYQCDACQRTFEVRQRITESPLTRCEVCGGAVRRLLSPAPFILKGEGWYVTDYPSEARKKAKESEKSVTAAKSETKSESKSETKSESKSEPGAATPEKSSTSTSQAGAGSSSSNGVTSKSSD